MPGSFNSGSISYTYDVLGRRVSRTQSGNTTIYVYDGPHIIAEYLNGSLIRKYIYGPGMDNPVAMVRRLSGIDYWYYYYADAQGSVWMLTDAGGVIKESYTYDVYGRPRVMRSSGADGNWLTEDVATYANSYITIGNRFMFTGREWDSTTGLYYYRFRDYSPTLGRFLQPDPAKYIDGMNLYAYCGNNPVNWIDPWGLADEKPGFWGKVWNTVLGWIPFVGSGAKQGLENQNLSEELQENTDSMGEGVWFDENYRNAQKKNLDHAVKQIGNLGKVVIDTSVSEGLKPISDGASQVKDAVDKAIDIKDVVVPETKGSNQ